MQIPSELIAIEKDRTERYRETLLTSIKVWLPVMMTIKAGDIIGLRAGGGSATLGYDIDTREMTVTNLAENCIAYPLDDMYMDMYEDVEALLRNQTIFALRSSISDVENAIQAVKNI
jgi:hypothetical protein